MPQSDQQRCMLEYHMDYEDYPGRGNQPVGTVESWVCLAESVQFEDPKYVEHRTNKMRSNENCKSSASQYPIYGLLIEQLKIFKILLSRNLKHATMYKLWFTQGNKTGVYRKNHSFRIGRTSNYLRGILKFLNFNKE